MDTPERQFSYIPQKVILEKTEVKAGDFDDTLVQTNDISTSPNKPSFS